MIEHTVLPVEDIKKAKAFYTAALEPLGYKPSMDFEEAVGFMEGGHTSFLIARGPHAEKAHVAFGAHSKEEIRAFHKAALEAGGTDNGAPGPRKDYSPDYYAAFIHDPEGNNIEAVYFDPEAA